MKAYSVDTNIFLRFLIEDDKQKTKKVKTWFKNAQKGKCVLVVEPFVIVEAAHMLSRYYKLPKLKVCELLRGILGLEFLLMDYRIDLARAIDVYEGAGIDFVDALLYVRAKEKKASLLSFDSDFTKLTPNLYTEP